MSVSTTEWRRIWSAYRARRDPATHKRLILVATIDLLIAALRYLQSRVEVSEVMATKVGKRRIMGARLLDCNVALRGALVQSPNRRGDGRHSGDFPGRPPCYAPGPVDARTQSALLAAIVCTALALAMLLRQGRTRLWTAFALLNLALLAYQIGDFLYGILGPDRPWALRLTLGASGFIPVAVLGFIVEFQGESAGRVLGLRRFATATALATVAVALSPLAMVPAARVAASGAVFVQLTAAVSLLLK